MMDDACLVLFKVCFPLKRNVTCASSHLKPICFHIYGTMCAMLSPFLSLLSSRLLTRLPPAPTHLPLLTLFPIFLAKIWLRSQGSYYLWNALVTVDVKNPCNVRNPTFPCTANHSTLTPRRVIHLSSVHISDTSPWVIRLITSPSSSRKELRPLLHFTTP